MAVPLAPEENEMVRLGPDECLRLLAVQPVGRLALDVPGEAPDVIPVNYRLVDGTILFRTVEGTTLRRLETEPVSFQVDYVDAFHRAGWSVLIKGLAGTVSDQEVSDEDVADGSYLPDRDHWVRITPESVTGRRIVLPVPEPMDPRGYL